MLVELKVGQGLNQEGAVLIIDHDTIPAMQSLTVARDFVDTH